MKKLYKWQKIVLWLVGILTIITMIEKVTSQTINDGTLVGLLLNIIIGVPLNLAIVWGLFEIGNRIFKKAL